MANGYSLRKAAELAGVPAMTVHGYKNRGIINPDVEDKHGNFSLYSDDQVRRAKDYHEQSSRSRKKSAKVEDEVSFSQGMLDQVEPVAATTLPATVEAISLEARADKIRKLQVDVQRGIIEIGRELNEAKKEVPHGQWGAWLAKEFEWTQQTANRFMRVAERFGKLNNVVQFQPSTLQAMLSLPYGEEEAFIVSQEAVGNPVENQSAREVIANIKAWKHRNEQSTADEPTGIEEQTEISNLATASVELSVENATRKQEFSSRACLSRMNKQLELIRKFITETESEEEIKDVLKCLESFKAEVIDVVSLADKKWESLKVLNDTE